MTIQSSTIKIKIKIYPIGSRIKQCFPNYLLNSELDKIIYHISVCRQNVEKRQNSHEKSSGNLLQHLPVSLSSDMNVLSCYGPPGHTSFVKKLMPGTE